LRTVLIAAAVFVLLGIALIPYAGIEDDEIAFLTPFFWPTNLNYSIRLFDHDVVLMIQSYAGTLKTLLYSPIYLLFKPGPAALRIPIVLIGAITIVLFYLLAGALAGKQAAILAALLLASDPIFLLTDTIDWGPVAIEHLLLVSGCLLFVKKRPVWGAFLFGLAMWNKATFIWSLAGLILAAIVAYFPEVRDRLSNWKAAVLAAAAFLVGMSPLVVYNLAHRNATAGSNVHFAVDNPRAKIWVLDRTLDGTGLFDNMVAGDWAGNPKTPRSLRARAAVWIRDHTTTDASSLFGYGVLMSLFALPFWWRSGYRRVALFALIASLVTFAMMFVTRDAGAAVHHAVLLWPMPQLFVAVALAALAAQRRGVLIAWGAVLVASNLLVTNRYFAQLARNGAYGNFTDAVYPLSNSIPDQNQTQIYAVDWGFLDVIGYLHRGKVNISPSSGPLFSETPDAAQRAEIEKMLANPNGAFVSHVNSLEVFRMVNEHLESAARAAGYRKETIRTYLDSNGRPVFEMFRYIDEKRD